MRDFVRKIIPVAVMVITVFSTIQSEALAGDSTLPGTLTSHSTLQSIGFQWDITGDDNHNGRCDVYYRISGAVAWKEFIPLFRVDHDGVNAFAGSLLFLDQGAEYEIRLALTDPDGGSTVRTETVSTRGRPRLPLGGRTLHVVPGSGGGEGSSANPFRGIAAAQSAALPGDTFLLDGGNYGGEIEFTASGTLENYIVWKGASTTSVILDGIRVNADHIWLENLTVKDRTHGLLTYNSPENVVIRRCTFTNCHYAINLNHGGNNWIITDNTIIGDQVPGTCSGSECYSGEGIELNHTSGHVVAYNSISHVADGISYPHKNCDIYGNEIFDTSDDGIELDYGYANNRCWQNRISNPKNNGISFQPVNGAPWYVLRNQVAAPLENAIKFRDADRAIIAHNTLVGWSGVVASGSNYLTRVQSNNNLWISVQDRYFWEYGSDDGFQPFWRLNLDYDGFDWGNYVYAVKWKGVRYNTLNDFISATGLELNGIQVDRNSCFTSFNVVQPPASMPFQHMTLTEQCNARNRGVVLPGINDDYTGTAPDLGAYEFGTELPHFGVRGVDLDGDGDVDGNDLSALSQLQGGHQTLIEAMSDYLGNN